MSAGAQVDYEALAKKYGGGPSQGADTDALAQKYGGVAGGKLEPPPKSFNEQLTERRDWPTYDPQHPIASVGRAVGTGVGNFGAGAIKGVEGLAGIPHMVMHPGDIPRETAETAIQMGKDIGEGHPEYVLGELGGAYLGGKALGNLPGVPKVVERVGGKIGEATREPPLEPRYPGQAIPKGALKPWVKGTTGALGAGGGLLAGGMLGEHIGPYGALGTMYGGARALPWLADQLLPRNPNVVSRNIPELPPETTLPKGASVSTVPRPGGPLPAPTGMGATTSTSGIPIQFGATPKAVDPVAQAVRAHTASWLPMTMPEAGEAGSIPQGTIPPIGSSGARPSPSEVELTNIVRKNVVTPEEYAREQTELGSKAQKKSGEGRMGRQGRVLGDIRARRGSKGMPEPE